MNEKLKEAGRNSNFSLSQGPKKVYMQTSSGASHTNAQFKINNQLSQKCTNAQVKQAMRGTNFSLGSDNLNYATTATQNNKQVEEETKHGISGQIEERIQGQKDRIAKNRIPKFSYGRDANDYQSMTKNVYKAHDASQAHKSF